MNLPLLVLLAPLLTAEERLRFESAIALHLASDLEAAVREYGAVLTTSPSFAPARLYRAEAQWLLGRREAAREDLEVARAKAGETLLFQLLERTTGSRSPADPRVEKLLRAYPLEQNRFLATGTPALVLLSLGEIEDAVADYRRVAELDPEDATLHRQLGSTFARAKLWLPAVEGFERVVAVSPEDVVAWRQLGTGNLVLQRWTPAIAAFERALALEGDEPNVLLALGYAYERTPDYDRALALYRRAARIQPGAGAPHYRIGRALLALSRLEEARGALERAHTLDPTAPGPLTFLGEVHLQEGNVGLAIETLTKAVSADEEFFEAYYRLAQALRRAGRDEEARAAIARYAELKSRKRDVLTQEEVLALQNSRP